nr:hypothetical protein [Tanacetum cinerariifolium]
QTFKTLCLLNYALMIRHDYDITSSLRRGAIELWYSEPGYETVGSKDLTCEDWMVNTGTDADFSAAVQNALQTLLPQIHAEIREEFCTSYGPSDAGGNPPPMVNTRIDADLSVAVQNALQALLTQTYAEIRKEFRTSFGPSDSGGNPPSVTIHT